MRAETEFKLTVESTTGAVSTVAQAPVFFRGDDVTWHNVEAD